VSKDKEKQLLAFLKGMGTKDKECQALIAYLEKDLKPIKVRSAKNKGLRLQHRVCELLSQASGIPYVQGSDDSLIQSRPGGQHGVDIMLMGEAHAVFPLSIECKNAETLSLLPAIEQAKANVKDNDDWLVVYCNSKLKEPLVFLEFATFLKHYFGRKHADK
jgi:hypothetical protein